jgi:hypothetical protein
MSSAWQSLLAVIPSPALMPVGFSVKHWMRWRDDAPISQVAPHVL